ncbi:Phosphatidylinositol N-acetylglucosaminyltransferase GPI3 subunit [Savitreella phatthalungensis]
MGQPRRKLAVAMVSDFFYPQPGGIESHIYQLSQRLIDRGHKVIIITHAYGDRSGVRYLTNGLKVYYVPFAVIYREATFPSVFSFFPVFRNIMLRERIEVVHGHASLSSLCHEAILHARTMGLRTCFTDHSLFGFADPGSILTNKLLKFTLSDIDHVICVSHTCKENTVLRAALDPQMVSVIPNAVVAEDFSPPAQKPPLDEIVVVVICRLFYNKGADLLVALIPRICELHPNVRFIVAGDGPKMIDLIQMREKCMLQDRVEMLGTVRHEQVRDVMVRGHIYLHPSLTEAFGTVIVEAASCGLYVVCTRVGGVPEVLPSNMTSFARPEVDDLVRQTSRAIIDMKAGRITGGDKFHAQVCRMYSWTNIAERTERVYNHIVSHHCAPLPLVDRLKKYYGCGRLAGKLFCFLVALDFLILLFLELVFPTDSIDVCQTLTRQRLVQAQAKVLRQDISDDESIVHAASGMRYEPRRDKRVRAADENIPPLRPAEVSTSGPPTDIPVPIKTSSIVQATIRTSRQPLARSASEPATTTFTPLFTSSNVARPAERATNGPSSTHNLPQMTTPLRVVSVNALTPPMEASPPDKTPPAADTAREHDKQSGLPRPSVDDDIDLRDLPTPSRRSDAEAEADPDQASRGWHLTAFRRRRDHRQHQQRVSTASTPNTPSAK